jgi:heme/copper-type cytochrome/quinol oxidase subunit 3
MADTPVDLSPAAIRARRDIEPRPTAWWGMMLTNLVVATLYGAMYFSYIWIRITQRDWPPAGVDPPPLDLAGLSAAALLASGAVLWVGLRKSHQGAVLVEQLALLGALLLAGLHLWLLVADLSRFPLGPGDHAYASLFYALSGIHASALLLAMILAAVLLAMSFLPEPLPRRGVGLRTLGAYWYLLAVAGALLIAVMYLTPHVWPVA